MCLAVLKGTKNLLIKHKKCFYAYIYNDVGLPPNILDTFCSLQDIQLSVKIELLIE